MIDFSKMSPDEMIAYAKAAKAADAQRNEPYIHEELYAAAGKGRDFARAQTVIALLRCWQRGAPEEALTCVLAERVIAGVAGRIPKARVSLKGEGKALVATIVTEAHTLRLTANPEGPVRAERVTAQSMVAGSEA